MQQDSPHPITRHYYLENFQVLADFVYSHYAALLSAQERHFYHTLNALPVSARLLCIRLLMRRGDYVRVSKINYPEPGSLHVALQRLQSDALLTNADVQDLPDWIGCFSRDELSRVTQDDLPVTPEKMHTPDLFGESPVELLLRLDTVYHLQCKPHYQMFLLLFFGNMHQDLSEFVLRDLGMRDYENYLTDPTALPFQSREQLLAYWQYYQCVSHFEEAAASGPDALTALFEEIPDNTCNDPVLKRRVHQLYNKIARQLERETAWDQAAAIYQRSDYPPARERLARVEANRGNYRQALQLCDDILSNATNSEELEFAAQFRVKVAKKNGIDAQPPEIYQPPELFIAVPASTLSVERATALHFAREGHCYYVENTLLTAAFGLTFWDIIFAPVCGVFFNPFQRAPLDFKEPEFVSRRSTLIDQRLQSIAQGRLREYLFRHFHHKQRLINPLVQWQSINYPLLATTVDRIPVNHWLAIFRYMLKDIKNHRSGLPDLIWFPNRGGYQLLEVKGPGDALQKHQRRWMKHFDLHHIPHAVVNADYRKRERQPGGQSCGQSCGQSLSQAHGKAHTGTCVEPQLLAL